MRILRGLSSQCLPCGCLAGIYETYDGEVIGILDVKSGSCPITTHQNGKQLPTPAPDTTESHPGSLDSSAK
jgi:hypothetical protein